MQDLIITNTVWSRYSLRAAVKRTQDEAPRILMELREKGVPRNSAELAMPEARTVMENIAQLGPGGMRITVGSQRLALENFGGSNLQVKLRMTELANPQLGTSIFMDEGDVPGLCTWLRKALDSCAARETVCPVFGL